MRVLELHMAMSVVQRSKGRSAVAAAAYTSGEELRMTTRNSGYAPSFARSIRARKPRGRFIVNFPHEFSETHRREAALKIAVMLADRYRGCVDYGVHVPDAKGDHRNHHGHFLLTARPFENGDWAKNKDRVLDDFKRGPLECKMLRENIAGVINNIAVRERMDVYGWPITIDGLPETGSKKRQGTLAFRTQGILKACWIALWNP